jgi:hypothetical protein
MEIKPRVEATVADTTGVAIGDLIANSLDFNDPISCTKATKFRNTANLWRPVLAVTDRRPRRKLGQASGRGDLSVQLDARGAR